MLVIDRQSNALHRVFGIHGHLSADGRLLAFASRYDGQAVAHSVVTVRDLLTGLSYKIPAPGETTPADCRFPAISGNGRVVAMECELPPAGNISQGIQIYLHDTQTGQTTLVSQVPAGVPNHHHSFAPDISDDGRYVVFNSMNRITGHVEGGNQVFRFDRATGETTLLSASLANEVHGFGLSFAPTLSADGQGVAFASSASHFVVQDGNGADDVFIVDPACAYSVTPAVVTALAAGDAVPVTVSTSAECTWVARSAVGWIGPATAAGVPGGAGSGQLILNVTANTTGVSRSAVINVAGQSLTLSQSATPCTYSYSQNFANVGAAGIVGGSVGLNASSTGCAWTAVSNAGWLTVSTTAGVGSGTIVWTAAPNGSGTTRSATITVGAAIYTVTQLGTNAPAVPMPPSSLTASVTGFAVTLSWLPPLGGAAVTGYVVEAALSPGGSPAASLSTATATMLHVAAPAGRYHVRVRALTSAGPSPPSNEIEILVPACAAPSPPSDFAATATGTTVLVTWTPAPGTAYQLEAGTSPGAANVGTFSVGSSGSVVASAPPGTYYLRVRAESGCGALSQSSPERVVTIGAARLPDPPVLNPAVVTEKTVTLTWQPPSSGSVTGYVLEAGSAPGLSDLATITLGSQPSFTTQNVPAGRYHVRIRSLNTDGTGPPSAEIVVVVP